MTQQLPLHLAIRPLCLNDADQVHKLESRCFPEAQAASLDAIKYRLTVCPELSSGLFVRSFGGKYNDSDEAKASNASNDASYLPDEKSSIVEETLIGHILSTKIHSQYIDEQAMKVPDQFLAASKTGNLRAAAGAAQDTVGHVESSNNIGLHSIAVHPDYRGKKIGTLLLHDYIQKLSNQQVGAFITILAQQGLLEFYQNLGFEDKGVSKCTHGGEQWHDMQIALVPEEEKL